MSSRLRPRASRRAIARILAGGCVWFGALALTRTKRMSEIVGLDESTVRILGVRDLASAATLTATRDPRAALVARTAFDVADTVTLVRRRPLMALVALGSAALGFIALRFGSQD